MCDWNSKGQKEEYGQQIEEQAAALGGKVSLTLCTGVDTHSRLDHLRIHIHTLIYTLHEYGG